MVWLLHLPDRNNVVLLARDDEDERDAGTQVKIEFAVDGHGVILRWY